MKEISRRAREALRLIGEESPINARRVSNLGVIVAQPNNAPRAGANDGDDGAGE